eukprot:c21081_g1_i1.p1 GENE.c21081_g1_i1~~c21081_g1_i1.p1  ORF type:complete len:753 (+),score=15.53 c21081_g1_i1:64-2259(+)
MSLVNIFYSFQGRTASVEISPKALLSQIIDKIKNREALTNIGGAKIEVSFTAEFIPLTNFSLNAATTVKQIARVQQGYLHNKEKSEDNLKFVALQVQDPDKESNKRFRFPVKQQEDFLSAISNYNSKIPEDLKIKVRNSCLVPFADYQNQKKPFLLDSVSPCWDWYSNNANGNDMVHIPKFYFTQDLTKLTEDLLFRIAFFTKMKNVGGGGNVILNGPKGIGKTSILKALAIFALMHNENAIIAYWNYQVSTEFPAVGELFYHAFICTQQLKNKSYQPQSQPTSREVRDVIEWIFQQESTACCYLFLDEVQEIYHPKNNDHHKNIVREILNFGKNLKRCFAILTGSSSTLRDKALTSNNEWRLCGFLSLNASVYGLHQIYPLREFEEVRAYLEKYYPQVKYEPKQLFDYTGGVFRYIEQFVGRSVNDIAVPEQLELASALENFNFMLIATLMMRDNKPFATMAAFNSKVPLSEVDYWCDKNILLKVDCDRAVELLFPIHFEQIKNKLDREIDHIPLKGLLATVIGWETGSAGSDAQQLVCLKCSNAIFGKPFLHGKITTQQGIKYFESKNTLKTQLANCWDSLLKTSFTIASDCGVDVVSIAANGEVHCAQIKLGKLDNSITTGVINRQRKNFKKKAKIDDSTIAGIIVKGERGFSDVLTILRTTFTNITFRASSFTLVTSKTVTADAQTAIGNSQLALKVDGALVSVNLFQWNQILDLFDVFVKRSFEAN